MGSLRYAIFWISRRTNLAITLILLGIAISLIWFLTAGFTPNETRITIGIAVVTTFLAAVSAIANLVIAVETQRQREDSQRPFVQGYFDAENNGLLLFYIQNFGTSPAVDITVKFGVAPVDHANRPLGELSLFTKPIGFIAPGQKFRQIVDIGYRLLADGKPTNFDYTITYASLNGQKYSEKIETDLAFLKQANVPGLTIEDHLGKIQEDLQKLAKVFTDADGWGSIIIESRQERASRLDHMAIDADERPKWKKELINIFQRLIQSLQK
jgi:hypothetical protein